MFTFSKAVLRCVIIVVTWTAACLASAGDYTEAGSGDLAGNRLAPTNWNVTAGINRLIAATSPGDQEYLRINIPAGHSLRGLAVQLYTTNDAMFIGFQQGTTFTVTPAAATAGDMVGYAHFGTAEGNVGTDILDDMASAPGAIGFTPPLPTGSYTFWLQQGTPGITTYQLNFDVVFRPGDYNSNGVVDAADYVVWRNTVGSTNDFRADGTGPNGFPDGVINQLDYNYWKQHYGQGPGSGTGNSIQVPEPTATMLLIVAGVFAVSWPLRKR